MQTRTGRYQANGGSDPDRKGMLSPGMTPRFRIPSLVLTKGSL